MEYSHLRPPLMIVMRDAGYLRMLIWEFPEKLSATADLRVWLAFLLASVLRGKPRPYTTLAPRHASIMFPVPP